MGGDDPDAAFPFCCLPRKMLLTDHNLKISLCGGTFPTLKCHRVPGKRIKYAEFPAPPAALLCIGPHRTQDAYLLLRALRNSDVHQWISLKKCCSGGFHISLGPQAPRDKKGLGKEQGIKERKDHPAAPQSSQHRKGMPSILRHGNRTCLWFRRSP